MIEKLKQIKFHDLEVDKLKIDIISNKLKLEVSLFNEDSGIYDKKKIIFGSLSNVNFNNIFIGQEYSTLEINSFDLIESDQFRAKFIFLKGFSKPSCELSFDFLSCIIV